MKLSSHRTVLLRAVVVYVVVVYVVVIYVVLVQTILIHPIRHLVKARDTPQALVRNHLSDTRPSEYTDI